MFDKHFANKQHIRKKNARVVLSWNKVTWPFVSQKWESREGEIVLIITFILHIYIWRKIMLHYFDPKQFLRFWCLSVDGFYFSVSVYLQCFNWLFFKMPVCGTSCCIHKKFFCSIWLVLKMKLSLWYISIHMYICIYYIYT